MFSSYSYKRALGFFQKHPRAHGIQRYRGGVTAGLIQPSIPNKIKYRGKTYTRAYVGGHNKRNANALVRGFRKGGLGAVTRKTKHGYQVFVHLR